MDMITINWTIKNGQGPAAPAAIGRVRFWTPKVLSDDAVIYGRPVPGDWITLDGTGSGTAQIPDPRSEDISPRYWSPLVEVDTDAWKAAPYPVVIPEDEAGPFVLQNLSPVIDGLAPGVVQLRGPGYRSEPIAAEVGDVLRWNPAFYHQSDQESMGDLVSVVDGAPARYLSSGTAVQGAVGHGALYLAASGNRVLRPVDWVVQAADLDEGTVTLGFMYRDSGAGNTFGHATLPGQVNVVNLGQV